MANRFGWRPSLPDHRDRYCMFGAEQVAALPPKHARHELLSQIPILDQLDIGSCTAHAILRAAYFAALKAGLQLEMLSRLQLYYDERSDEGTVLSDSGAAIRTGMKSIAKRGCGLESIWPYVPDNFTARPPQAAYQSALDHQAIKYAAVQPIITQLKAALLEYPVVFGTTVFQSIELPTTASSGQIPVPTRFEQSIGGHAILLNGEWDDEHQWFGIDNSWGEKWGRKGLGYLPYWFVANGMVSDCWVLYRVEGNLPTPEPLPPKPDPTPGPTPTPIPIPAGRTIGSVTVRDNTGTTIAALYPWPREYK